MGSFKLLNYKTLCFKFKQIYHSCIHSIPVTKFGETFTYYLFEFVPSCRTACISAFYS